MTNPENTAAQDTGLEETAALSRRAGLSSAPLSAGSGGHRAHAAGDYSPGGRGWPAVLETIERRRGIPASWSTVYFSSRPLI